MTVGFRPEAARNSSVASTRRSICAGADVVARRRRRSRCAGWRARGGPAPPCSSAGSGRSWASRRRRRRTGSCPWRGRSRSTRAASSRRGSASGRCAGRRGRPGGSRRAGAGPRARSVLPMRPSDRAADDARALGERLVREVLAGRGRAGRRVERAAVVGRRAGASPPAARGVRALPGGRTGAALAGAAAGSTSAAGGAAFGGGVVALGGSVALASAFEAALGRRGVGRGSSSSLAICLASSCAASAPGRSWRPCRGARRCRCCRRRPGARRSGRGACSSPTCDDLAVVDGDRPASRPAGEDVDPAAVLVGLDDERGVAPRLASSRRPS